MYTRGSKEDIQNNPYQFLDLPTNASHSDVRNAYKKLILEYHPDRVRMNNQGCSEEEITALTALAQEKFNDIQEAYELISKGNNNPSHSSPVRPDNTDAYTYTTHVEVPDIAPDTVVIKKARVKVYLPIYVIGKAVDNGYGYGIRITMPELEDKSSRFVLLRQKINESLSYKDDQVGIDKEEVNKIIGQHSWYKDITISFVGCVEILLPLYHLNPREGKSEQRSTPYFSIKKNSQIGLADITAFSTIHRMTLNADPSSSRLNKLIESAIKGEIVNTNENIQPVILPTKFNYDQPLNSNELIEEALSQYRKEYELSVQYHSPNTLVLEDIKKIQDIHQQDISPQQKFEDLTTKINQRGGRFKKIIDAMTAYYQQLAAENMQQSALLAPSLTSTSITTFDHRILNNDIAGTQPSITNQLKSSLQTFLINEIASIQQKMVLELDSKTKVGNKLLGWISQQNTNNNPTTHEVATSGYKSDKIDKLRAILNWLQRQTTASEATLNNVKLLVHSICALKRKAGPRISASQKHFEEIFNIDSEPVLDSNDLKPLNSENDVASLCQTINEKLQNTNTVECKM